MKHALVLQTRLCEVHALPFPVADPLRWIECADDVTPETHDFDGSMFVAKPPPPPPPLPPTQTELEADALAALNGGAGRIDLQKLVKAVVISNLSHRLGKPPGQLTAQELLNERNRIAAIYKAL